MRHEWQRHIQPHTVYQWLNWSHANHVAILRQEWRKSHALYCEGYGNSELLAATQEAVMSFLRYGTAHASPNFETWLNYWCWWAIVMEYAWMARYLDAVGSDSTFHRWQSWLRIARDELLGVEPEASPEFVPLLHAVQPLNNSKEPDMDKLFDPENAEWELELSA